MSRATGWLLCLLLSALVLAASGSVAPVQSASAADAFSINPAVNGGVDASRSIIDFGTMAVAASKTDNVLVKNTGDKSLSLVVLARFSYQSPDGKSSLIDDTDAPAYDSAAWVTFGPNKVAAYSLNLAAGKSAVVPVYMTIPKGAYPGAHQAAIVVAAAVGTGTVTVAKRVALYMKVTVPGTLLPASSPTWVKTSSFYELNIRNFTAARTFKGALAQVDDLKLLGVGAVIMDPIFAIGTAQRAGTLGSIMAVSDLNAVNPSLGTVADFKALVTALKAAGIKVVLHVPLQNAAIDAKWTTDSPNWFVRNGTYDLVTDAATPYLATYDYSQPELRQAMFEALKGWVTTQDIDGYVFDNATAVDLNLVNELAYRLQSVKSVWLATNDPFSDAYQTNALVSNGNDDLRKLLEGMQAGTQTATTYSTIIGKMNDLYSGPEFPLNWVSNYDTMVGLKTETARMGAALPAAVALTFTLPGAPSIWQGQEIANIKALKPYDADNIVWPAKAPAGLATYIKLVKLKKLNSALFNAADGGEVVSLKTASTSLLAFKRTKGTNNVIVIVNLSKKALTTKFDAGAAATMFLFSTDKSVKLAASGNSVTVPAFGYEIYTPAVVK